MEIQNIKPQNIDEYILNFLPEIREILQSIRSKIQESAPNATEAISYQMPTFKLIGNLVHFAAFKNHIGFYPTASGITNFENELISYKTSKGAIQFPLNKPIPLDLIEKITKFRVLENINKGKKK